MSPSVARGLAPSATFGCDSAPASSISSEVSSRGMYRVLVSDALSEAGLALLKKNPQLDVVYSPGIKEAELAEKVADADALVIRSGSKVTKKVIDAATKLGVIGRA